MSADNGIYILETLVHDDSNVREYRVCHAQCIGDLWYWDGEGVKDEINPKRVREFFGTCDVYTDKAAADVKANSIAQELRDKGLPLEYGIQMLYYGFLFPKE